MIQDAQSKSPQDGNQIVNLQEPASRKSLHSEQQPKLKKIKTRTTIVEQREDEDLVYERIKNSRFKQQRLPAWRPVPTINSIIVVFSVFGVIFIILGIILLVYSNKVHSSELDYTNCILNSICHLNITIEEKIDKPVFVYYQLDGFYQNSRRYLKSKNIEQLRGLNENASAIPCGLMAKTFFNDTFEFSINNSSLSVDETNIAFDKDRDLFKKNLDKSKQWLDMTNEHFLVWMRPSGLPNPRKLWGKIDQDLNKDDLIFININNNYDVSPYKGKKKIILSNATVFGGKNKFLGISYIVVGCLSILCAIIFPIGYKFQLEKEKNL